MQEIIKRLAMLSFAMTLVLSASACTAASDSYGKFDPVVVSTEQAELLSVMRLNNYEREVVRFEMSVPQDGTVLHFIGRVDLVDHRGYGVLSDEKDEQSAAYVVWTDGQLAMAEAVGDDFPVQPPEGLTWKTQRLGAGKSVFENSLQLLLKLASDRPENPLLLRQNGAQFHGRTDVNGVSVSVYTGPGADNQPTNRVRYFLSDDGKLLKIEADLSNTGMPVTINLLEEKAPKIVLPAK